MSGTRSSQHVGVNAHLVVARAQIQLGEETGAVELVEELLDHRNWELILDGALVEGAVVHAEKSRAVVFLDEEDGCGERRGARADDALVQHGGHLALQLILLELWVVVRAYRCRRRARQQVSSVVTLACRQKAGGRGEDIVEGGQEGVQHGRGRLCRHVYDGVGDEAAWEPMPRHKIRRLSCQNATEVVEIPEDGAQPTDDA